MSQIYESAWNQYWETLLSEHKGAFWDGSAQLIKEEVFHTKDHFEPSLPLMDLGCGTGHRTNLFSSFHPNVIGLDISEAVIAHARSAYPNLQFLQADILDVQTRAQLSDQLGNVNIYCRGVIHQIAQEDRRDFITSMIQLSGSQGTIYMQEMAVDFKQFISKKYLTFSDTPLPIKKVLFSKFSPQPLDVEETTKIMEKEGLRLLEKGDSTLNITLPGDEKNQLEVPAVNLTYTPLTSY